MARTRGRAKRTGDPTIVVNYDTIYSVARRLFSQKGFAETSMHDIASELGVQRGSLYHHIESKDEILVDIIGRPINELLPKIERVASTLLPCDEKIRIYFMIIFEMTAIYPEEILIWVAERQRTCSPLLEPVVQKGRRADQILMEIIEEGIASESWQPMDQHLAYQTIRGMIAWFPHWYRSDGRLSVSEIASSMARWAILILNH